MDTGETELHVQDRTGIRALTADDLLSIPLRHYPLAALSDYLGGGIMGWFTRQIKAHQHGEYSHFMWLHRPGYFASQDAYFEEVPIERYLAKYRIKLWYCPTWYGNADKTKAFQTEIRRLLALPKADRFYDWQQIWGILIGWRRFNHPDRRVCSDYADLIKILDAWYFSFYKRHPTPTEVHGWFKQQKRYEVYGVYEPNPAAKT